MVIFRAGSFNLQRSKCVRRRIDRSERRSLVRRLLSLLTVPDQDIGDCYLQSGAAKAMLPMIVTQHILEIARLRLAVLSRGASLSHPAESLASPNTPVAIVRYSDGNTVGVVSRTDIVPFALTGVVPPVCDAEAGHERGSKLRHGLSTQPTADDERADHPPVPIQALRSPGG